MKTRYVILFICITSAFACGNNNQKPAGQTPPPAQGWTDEEREEFTGFCVTHLNQLDSSKARQICNCIADHAIKTHPNAEHADTLEQQDWETLIINSNCITDKAMLNDVSFWGRPESESFTKHCIAAAKKQGNDATQAKAFCSCALEKVKKLVPNPHLTSGFTDEEYNSILHDCEVKP